MKRLVYSMFQSAQAYDVGFLHSSHQLGKIIFWHKMFQLCGWLYLLKVLHETFFYFSIKYLRNPSILYSLQSLYINLKKQGIYGNENMSVDDNI